MLNTGEGAGRSIRLGLNRRRLVLLGLLLLGSFGIFILSERWTLATARSEAHRGAASTSLSNAGLLSSELQKFRLLHLVLADYPDVVAPLNRATSESIATANRALELLAHRTNAIIYLIDRGGVTIAASNWRLPSSFVGQNYGFRPYFTSAMKTGAAEQFALGTISRRPGLFLARRTASGAGVIVVKVEFEGLEHEWAKQPDDTIVRDANGVVIISSRRSWLFRSTRPIGQQRLAQFRRTRLYGDGALQPLSSDLVLPRSDDGVAIGSDDRRYAAATVPVPVRGWTLTSLEPLEPALTATATKARAAALALLLVIVVGAGGTILVYEKRQLEITARRSLEEEVRRRTAELSAATDRLRAESAERERNEARLRSAREELARANRLGTLGQITAGVAHEVNQPVAAIRTFAENAAVLSQRGDSAGVSQNLAQIVELTQRIGRITSELRLFARRDHTTQPVLLAEAIDGALLLVNDRIATQGVEINRHSEGIRGLKVIGDRVRLEQTFINLIQNAADALTGVADPRIRISCEERGKSVVITIADNGPGISPDLVGRLFTPFVTGKADGLGLGLVISRDIVRDFGGELWLEAVASGAAFSVQLRKA